MLSKDAVEKVARLARLRLDEKEMTDSSRQLSAVLENFQAIAAIDTSGVVPMVTPTAIELNLRSDVVNSESRADSIIECAPEKTGRLFKVPPVV